MLRTPVTTASPDYSTGSIGSCAAETVRRLHSGTYLDLAGQDQRPALQIGLRAWDSDCGEFTGTARWQGDVYVFALLAHANKATVNPLELDQWRFYVLPTAILDARSPTQRSISLATLKTLTSPIRFEELQAAITDSPPQGPNQSQAGGHPDQPRNSDSAYAAPASNHRNRRHRQ